MFSILDLVIAVEGGTSETAMMCQANVRCTKTFKFAAANKFAEQNIQSQVFQQQSLYLSDSKYSNSNHHNLKVSHDLTKNFKKLYQLEVIFMFHTFNGKLPLCVGGR